MRDLYASSPSYLNATGGLNGRPKIAVVKSFLIDLELLVGNAEDNKGQATFEWAA